MEKNNGQAKALLIFNPRAGMSIRRPKVQTILRAAKVQFAAVDFAVTAHRGHAKEIAAHCGKDYDVLLCCGGDGTLNEVVSGLAMSGATPAIGYLPIGSTNDLAKNLGVPSNLPRAMETVAAGCTHGFDVASFNSQYFTYIASFGPGVSVSYQTPQRFKNLFGYSAYMVNGFVFQVIPTLRALKPKHLKIEYDGGVLEEDVYFGTVSNTLSAAGLFRFDQNEVRFNDGKFEVVLVCRLHHPWQAATMLKQMRLHEYDGKLLVHFQASRLHITFPEPEVWTLDGESSGAVQDVEIAVHREAARFFCPDSRFFLSSPPIAAKKEALCK